jgi:two-component system CheB/CheR fusion protein
LYRIAQEAINNAVKHSGASHVEIRLSTADNGLELEIRDDGLGIKAKPGRAGGMGLHIMDYRARTIGGNLEIRDTGAGTTVSCRAPNPDSYLNAETEALAG